MKKVQAESYKVPAPSSRDSAEQIHNVVFLPGSNTQVRTKPQGRHSQASCGSNTLMLFKLTEHRSISDSFGELFSSALIRLVQARLHTCLRDGDSMRQLGDDEFAITLAEPGETENISAIADRLIRESSGVYSLDNTQVWVKGMIGIHQESKSCTPQDAIRFARIALRHAEHKGSNGSFQFFKEALLDGERDKLCMSAQIEEALAENRMKLFYQPQYTLDNSEIISVEALVRMETRTGDLVAPDRFIPIAEDNGLIIPLGRWVIREACRQLHRWRKAGNDKLRMCVNVSPRQLTDPSLLTIIDDAVRHNGLEHSDLTLELTEQCIVEQLEDIQDLLHTLNERGVRIAIDDFGTGYSSFAYLSRIPVDTIKMDRSFLTAVPADEKANRTLAAMNAMVEKLELDMIVEGVETAEQEAFLIETGCRIGQGFGLARPQPAAMLSRAVLQPRH